MHNTTSLVVKNVQAAIDAMWNAVPNCTWRKWNPFAIPCNSQQVTHYNMAKNQQAVFDAWRDQASLVHSGQITYERWAGQGQEIMNAARSLSGLTTITDPWFIGGEAITERLPTIGSQDVTKLAYIAVAGVSIYAVAKVLPVLLDR